MVSFSKSVLQPLSASVPIQETSEGFSEGLTKVSLLEKAGGITVGLTIWNVSKAEIVILKVG